MKTIAIMTACLAAGLASAGASAQTADQPVTVAVSYADLDLSGAAGRATLARRIRHAADRICRDPSARDTLRMQLVSQCLAATTRDVQAQAAAAIARARVRTARTDLAAR